MPMPDDVVETYRSQLEGRPVLLFDGVCVFCNRTVQFLIRHDREAVLRFVPLESPLGQALLAPFDAQQGPEGVILITNALTPSARLSRRTEAFSDALQLLPRPWSIVGKALRLVPRLPPRVRLRPVRSLSLPALRPPRHLPHPTSRAALKNPRDTIVNARFISL